MSFTFYAMSCALALGPHLKYNIIPIRCIMIDGVVITESYGLTRNFAMIQPIQFLSFRIITIILIGMI